MAKVRFENYVFEYDDSRNYFVLPDGRKIIVDNTYDLGNHGWLNLTQLPFSESVSIIIEPINTRFPLVGVITPDGKTVFIQQSYAVNVITDGVLASTVSQPSSDFGALIKPDKKVSMIKVGKIYYELYGVSDNGIVIMDKTGKLKDEIALPFNAKSLDTDKFETRLFTNDNNNVYIINMASKEIEGSVHSDDTIKKVVIDKKNDNIVMLHNDGYKVLDKNLNLVKKIQTDIPVKDIVIDAVKDNKEFLMHDNKISVYDGLGTDPKGIINLPISNYTTNFYDPIHDKIYVASNDFIVTVNPITNTTTDIKSFQCAKSITGVSFSGDIYITNCKNETINVKTPDVVKNTPISNAVSSDADDNKIYILDDKGNVFNADIDTYIPVNLVEINRGQVVTGANCITVHVNPSELTNVPDKMRIIEGTFTTDWFVFSPLVNYCFKNKGNGIKDLIVEITDKNNNEFKVNTPTIFVDSSQPDTRNPNDVTGDLKTTLQTITTPTPVVEDLRVRLTLETKSNILTVGTTTDLRAVWQLAKGSSFDVTGSARFVVSDSTVGEVSNGQFNAIKKGNVTIAAFSGDLKSNSVNMVVLNAEDPVPDKPIYQRLVLEANKYQVKAGESITLKTTAYYSQGNIFDFTTYVDKYNVSDGSVGSINGHVFTANKSGQTDIITHADGLDSNSITVKVLSTAPQINTALLLEVDNDTIHVGETAKFKASWILSSGIKFNLTDTTKFSFDASIGTMADGLFTATNKGDTAVTASISGITSNSLRLLVLGANESVNVLPAPILMNASLQAEQYKVLVGQKVKLNVIGKFSDKTEKDVTSNVNQFGVYVPTVGSVTNGVFNATAVGSTGVVAVIPPLFSMPINVQVFANEADMSQAPVVAPYRNIGIPTTVGTTAQQSIDDGVLDDINAIAPGTPLPFIPQNSSQDSSTAESRSYAERKKSALKIPDVAAQNVYTGADYLDTIQPRALLIHKSLQSLGAPLTNPPDRITAPLSQDEIRSSSPSWNTVVIDQVVFLHTDLGLDMEGNAKIAVQIPDATQYHKFHLLDSVTIFLTGPKQDYNEMQQLVNQGQPQQPGPLITPNNNIFRDKIMAMFRDEGYYEEKRLVSTGKSYFLYSDKIQFNGMAEQVVNPLVDSFNNDSNLKQIVRNASIKYKIEPEVLAALMIYYSGLNPDLIRRNSNSIMRIGLMQITQSMAREKGETTNVNKLLDPTKNIEVACYFINKHKVDTGNDPVQIALFYGVGKLTEVDNMEWGVKEPVKGYLDSFINVYNSVLFAKTTNRLMI